MEIKSHPSYQYAAKVVSGEICAPRYVCLQAREFKRIADDQDPEFCINLKTVKKIDKLLKLMVMPKGLKAGQSIYAASVGYQWLFYIATLCVVYREERKRRRYETAVLEIARKNFKTYTIAVLFLLLFFLEPKFSKFFSVAPDGTLSREVKSAIEEIIKASPALRPEEEPERHFKIRLNDITFKPKDILYIPLNYSNSRLDGRLPSAFLVDEAGALPNPYAIQAMRSGQLTIRNKLGVVISTKYPNTQNPFEDEVNYVKRVLDGVIQDKTVFALLFEPDNPKEWMTDDTVLKHANPAAMEIPEIWEDLLKKRCRAIEVEAERENFLCKHCNITYQGIGTEAYIAIDAVRACKAEEKLDWTGMQVYLGVDLSMSNDNCSVAMAGMGRSDEVWGEAIAFIPEDRIEEKNAAEHVDYRRFIDAMKCIACGGQIVDYGVIEDFVFDIEEMYGVTVAGIAYDRFNAMSSAQKWERGREATNLRPKHEGYPTVIVRQHSDTLHPPTKLLYELIMEGKFRYEENQLLEINFENARCTFDTNHNRYVNKKRSNGKVDMVVALINAMYLLQQNEYFGESMDWVVQSI
ncbi:MAG: terminase [Oscillospiraceae bacterium]|nr:terminase [Oscillospiraceae bacterium]